MTVLPIICIHQEETIHENHTFIPSGPSDPRRSQRTAHRHHLGRLRRGGLFTDRAFVFGLWPPAGSHALLAGFGRRYGHQRAESYLPRRSSRQRRGRPYQRLRQGHDRILPRQQGRHLQLAPGGLCGYAARHCGQDSRRRHQDRLENLYGPPLWGRPNERGRYRGSHRPCDPARRKNGCCTRRPKRSTSH